MINRQRLRILYLLVAIVFLLNAALGYTYCPSYPDVEQEFFESELVFVGKVISEEKINETPEGYFDGINYQLSVSESLKGNPKSMVRVFSENSSGRFPMVIGEPYLVFTSMTPGTFAGSPVYTISYCGNSGELAKKKKALSLARVLSKKATSK
jgi:hypothetical protein